MMSIHMQLGIELIEVSTDNWDYTQKGLRNIINEVSII